MRNRTAVLCVFIAAVTTFVGTAASGQGLYVSIRQGASQSYYGQTVSLYACICYTEISCGWSADATFLVDDRPLGTADLVHEYYICYWPLTTRIGNPGSHRLDVQLSPWPLGIERRTNPITHVVKKTPVAISVERPTENVLDIRAVPWFVWDRLPASVSVSIDGGPVEELPLDDGGAATFALDSLPGGSHVANIRYAGDAFFEAADVTCPLEIQRPDLAVAGVAFDEGDDGQRVVAIPVTLSRSSPLRVTATWLTTNGTATEDEDYVPAGGTVTFEPGETATTIPITINGDDLPEDTETFGIVIRDASHARIVTETAEVRLFSDDALYDTYPDVIYGEADGRLLMMTLRVPALQEPHPLVVAIEAPSWSFVTRHATGAEWLAHRGYAVATVEFTPSTIGVWPRQIDDVRTAVTWLREHAADFGIDAKHIGVLGIRAGAQLAAHLGLRSGVQAAVVWNGPLDFSRLESCGSLYSDVAMLVGGTPEACVEQIRSACPTWSAVPTSAPFLVLHRGDDCEVPFAHATAFTSALRANAADVTLAVDDGSGARELVTRFFDEHLRGAAVKRRATP